MIPCTYIDLKNYCLLHLYCHKLNLPQANGNFNIRFMPLSRLFFFLLLLLKINKTFREWMSLTMIGWLVDCMDSNIWFPFSTYIQSPFFAIGKINSTVEWTDERPNERKDNEEWMSRSRECHSMPCHVMSCDVM